MKQMFIMGIALLFPMLISAGATTSVEDAAISKVTEQCGNWIISYNWSDMDDCTSSASHSNSESGGAKTVTDALTMSSTDGSKNTLKIGILKYQVRDKYRANLSSLRKLANETILKAGTCENISYSPRKIDGKTGAFLCGNQCSGGRTYFVAVYPVDYYYDKSERAMTSNALGMIITSYSEEITERLLNSLKIRSSAIDYASQVLGR